MSEVSDKLARILRIDKNIFADLQDSLAASTGKIGIIDKIAIENEVLVFKKLEELGLKRNSYASNVYEALIVKLAEDDRKVYEAAGLGVGIEGQAAAQKICDFIAKVLPPRNGWFIKKEKAREFLLNIPPMHIVKGLGYNTASEMLEKEDLLEVFSALRFLEDGEWLNNVFFKQYENLSPDDFEERPIEIRALNNKWAVAAEKFVKKKYHNVSHLKEMGVIFVIPIFMNMSGETLRLVSLLAHYLNEVKYYSDLFVSFSKEEKFADSIISLLRGDVAEERGLMHAEEVTGSRFLVIQRYLAKGDEHDWRLFVPHVNPEAVHWSRAEDAIVRIPEVYPDFKNHLDFWRGLGWVGDYFGTESGLDVLVSFNIVDTVMSLVKKHELIKYLYHHQEALWNRIFIEYYGEEKMMQLIRENIVKGWFEV
ncbi:MAG TPA: hypothetical protein VI432_02425 [Candidatus Paceibacterota bacterium]